MDTLILIVTNQELYVLQNQATIARWLVWGKKLADTADAYDRFFQEYIPTHVAWRKGKIRAYSGVDSPPSGCGPNKASMCICNYSEEAGMWATRTSVFSLVELKKTRS